MRVSVIGVSAVAVENYLPYLAAQPDIQLTVYNRTAQKATDVAERFGARVAASLTDAADTDVALVLTTEPPRAGIVAQLIDAGTPRIFCEKPFVARDGQDVGVADFEDGRALLARASDAGVELAQQFNYRFMAPVARALETADARGFGAVTTFSAESHYGCWAHVVDLIALISGGVDRVSAVHGQVRTGHGITAPDLAATVHGRSGVVGSVVAGVTSSWDRPLFRMRVTYERGAVAFADFGDPVEVQDFGRSVDEVLTLPRELSRWDQYRASFATSLDAYFAAVRAGAPAPVRGLDGVEQLRLESAFRLSAESGGRPVELDAELPL